MPVGEKQTLLFGPFELDPQIGQVRKNGVGSKLQGQPVQILEILLEKPGQLVTREEICQRLWASDTFVDFDHSLNSAIKKLRQALGDEADTPRYIETLPKRGYRFIAPADPSASIGVEQGEPLSAPAATGAGSKKRWRKWAAIAACLTAIGLVAVGAWYLRSGRLAQIDSIAVLPFTNVGGDASTDYLGDGISETLTYNLTHVPQLKVRSRASAFRYKGKDVDLQKIGDALGVSALVSGRVVSRGDDIEVSAELTDVRDNTVVWGQHYIVKSTEIIMLQQQIASELAVNLRSRLSDSKRQQVAKQGTQNPEAYEFYLRGRYAWNRRRRADIETAVFYFDQAIAKDPRYALAYSGLADAYSVFSSYGGGAIESLSRSSAAARKALELDATLAHPHAVLGFNLMNYDWDFAGGEAEFKKALELDPGDATAHMWYAITIGRIAGREQQGLAEINRAQQLDPLSSIIREQSGMVLFWARRYDEAIAVCKTLASDDPTFAVTHNCLAWGYWGKHMYPQAIEEWKIYGQLSGDWNRSDFASALEQGFRSAGWRGALLKGIEAMKAQRKPGYWSAGRIAALYAELGDKDQAFSWLNTAYQEHDELLEQITTFPPFDPLRSDPRFIEMVRRVGLPQ